MLLWMLVLLPVLLLLAECAAALLPAPRISGSAALLDGVRILIPAHNEEAALHHCLHSVMSQGLRPDQITVIADRCTDRTAEIAREAGTCVIEHSNPNHPFKGYALAYGIQ